MATVYLIVSVRLCIGIFDLGMSTLNVLLGDVMECLHRLLNMIRGESKGDDV